MDKNITGVMVYYYAVCKRKLWYFYHDISMEQNNENVAIGKLIDENSYARDRKHINIDNIINIDFVSNENVLHEIKKSKKIEEASVLQVKYYLYFLKKRGVNINARLDYPLLKQTLDISLSEVDEKLIDNVLADILKIVSDKKPIKCDNKKICKVCAFYDLCFI